MNQDFQQAFFEHQKGNYEIAKRKYESVLSSDPNHFEALYFLGLLYAELTEFEQAKTLIQQAVSINPAQSDAWNHLGLVLYHLRDYSDAEAAYNKSLTINQENIETLLNYAVLQSDQKKIDEAKEKYKKIITLNPNHFIAYLNLGNLYQEQKHEQQAMYCYIKAQEINPEDSRIHNNIGLLHYAAERYEEAKLSYERALRIDPKCEEAICGMSAVLIEINNCESAIKIIKKAIQNNKKNNTLYFNLGNALKKQRKFSEAINEYKRSIEQNKNFDDAYINLGMCQHELKNYIDAISSYKKALQINSESNAAAWNLGLANLTLGNFQEGWEGYEYRLKIKVFNKYYSEYKSIKNLGDIRKSDKVIVWCEQGLGDSIQFSRFLNPLIGYCKNITFHVQPELYELVKHSFGDLQVVSEKSKDNFDYQVPLLSLPKLFRVNSDSIPNNVPYLKVNQKKAIEWRNRLGINRSRKNVALAYFGNPNHINNAHRSIDLKNFGNKLDDMNIYIVQKIPEEQKMKLLNFTSIKKNYIYLGDFLSNFEDTAAIIQNMDAVISIDTALAHLAGALAKKTFILLPWSSEWRWMSKTMYTPWYPTATLIRQLEVDDWRASINTLVDGLMEKNDDNY
jgi:tetratricopeptide (TPR) repeat protein